MKYKVRLSKRARKVYVCADKALAKKLKRCFQILESTPKKHPNIKRLKGELAGQYRYRVGDYRVIYEVREQSVEVFVALITPRGSAY